MSPQEACKFVEKNGVVLEAAAGAAPSLAEAIAGEPLRGSWWAHPKGKEIFAATRAVRASPEVLVCRWLGGKVTFVHRRLWPALVRLADGFPEQNLARIEEVHTAAGRHEVRESPYPQWVPAEVAASAARLTEAAARKALRAWLKKR